ncbi:hypothetical protein DFH29DRAFT_237464 [Suillus ampliporus]|nr:hypothetical protein DFH29DRAFT_237464 [Suillus ampliporus]
MAVVKVPAMRTYCRFLCQMSLYSGGFVSSCQHPNSHSKPHPEEREILFWHLSKSTVHSGALAGAAERWYESVSYSEAAKAGSCWDGSSMGNRCFAVQYSLRRSRTAGVSISASMSCKNKTICLVCLAATKHIRSAPHVLTALALLGDYFDQYMRGTENYSMEIAVADRWTISVYTAEDLSNNHP